ncbi:testis-specific serine/threonine-protein kinase 4 isoform X2 [Mauremys mutica]|uniref:testis-specific serine/threonine-protein kinase 4 isoform X2 n=1 Tax=Mauremys mutica TaxID=74926 RepID=UPI001D16D7FC|nr:testis-specific serine/threonine-protein kinase 4 isoform X2 [Mauremys mutica]
MLAEPWSRGAILVTGSGDGVKQRGDSLAPDARSPPVPSEGREAAMVETAPSAPYLSVMDQYGYQLGKVIGHGSYGIVYEAYFTKQKAKVAIKIISKKKASEDYLNKFLPREIQVMKGLHHKYLITFYQAIETTSRHYIVMELAPGGDILEWIQNSGPCAEPLAGRWFAQLTLGVAYLHSKGIVHRDLKLENLLLDKRENVKISDFGFSKQLVSQSEGPASPSYPLLAGASPLSQTYCGSFAYACPEILLGLPYNPFLADTWSMGVILYTLAVAHLPFDDTNLKRLLRETQKEDLVHRLLCPAARRPTVLDLLQTPWVLRFQSERPHTELQALEAAWGVRAEGGRVLPRTPSLPLPGEKKRGGSVTQPKVAKLAEKGS